MDSPSLSNIYSPASTTASSPFASPRPEIEPISESAVDTSGYDAWIPDRPKRRPSVTTFSTSQSVNGTTSSTSSDHLPFDEEFQRLISEVSDDRILKEESAFRSLSRLSRDFRFAAMTYGKVIIAEKHLPEAEKTIKPCGDLPGLAGGEKYLAGGILFRFAVDRHLLYGSDELAGKEAAHQLRGLTEVVSTGVEGLHFPLMALLDYRGYRLLAVSRLPIKGSDTLVLGSQDAGATILEGTDTARSRVAELAKALNLKLHRVSDRNGVVFSLHGPCDLEVHEGPEQRLYAVDFARLFPPEPQSLFGPPSGDDRPKRLVSFETDPTTVDEDEEANDRCLAPHLVRLLRPELVRTNDKPLSSDTFSHFGALDRQENEAEVNAAGKRLVDLCIPAAASTLNAMEIVDVTLLAKEILRYSNPGGEEDASLPSTMGGEVSGPVNDWISSMNANGRMIVSTLHKNGVNMRHIGRVYTFALTKWQKQLLNEAVARCVKARVRAAMRQTMRRVRTAVLTPFLSAVTDQLNLTLGCPPCTRPSSRACSCDAACRCLCVCPAQSTSPVNSVEGSVATFSDTTPSDDAIRKAKWWCFTLPQMLRERFGFKNVRELLLLSEKRDAHSASRCHCCGCGFSRYLSRPLVFAKVSESCGLVLSPPSCSGLLESLARPTVRPGKPTSSVSPSIVVASPALVSRHSPSLLTPSSPPPVHPLGEPVMFDFPEPFDEGAIVDVLGNIKVLPYLDYASGTALLIKARNMKNSGAFGEAKRLARAAKQSFDAGLAQCPTDPRLLCNLGFLLEDVIGSPEQALRMYEESVLKNPMHARSHYYLALSLWRKWQKQTKSFQDFGLLERAHHHLSRAADCSPWNANILKDFGRFKLIHRKDADGALQLLKRAIEAEPTHLRAHEALGLLYEQKKNDFSAAVEVWRSLATIKCSLPESVQGRLYLVRGLLKLKEIDEAEVIARVIVEDMQSYRILSRGHSDRPSAAWACKCSRLMVEVAEGLAATRGKCSNLVHQVFEVASHMFSWFGVLNDKKLDKAGAREQAEMRKSHVHILTNHGNHVFICDCGELDHRGLAQDLFDRAVQIDPTTRATVWARQRFENQTEGLEPALAVVLTKDDSNSETASATSFEVFQTPPPKSAFSQVVKSTKTPASTSTGKRKEQPSYTLRASAPSSSSSISKQTKQ